MKCSRRPLQSVMRHRFARPPRTSSAIRRAASGSASALEAAAIAASAVLVGEERVHRVEQQLRAELGVVDHLRRAGPLHPGRVRRLMPGGRVRVGDEDRRPPGRGHLEDRAAGAAEDEVAGGEPVAEVGLVVEQHVAVVVRGARQARLQLGVVAAPGDVDDVEVTALTLGEGGERALVDRAGALAAADHQQAAGGLRDPEAGPCGASVGGQHGGGDRAPGDDVAAALAPVDREGEADPPRAGREQPVGEAEVAVGLGQHQGRAGDRRRQARRAGDDSRRRRGRRRRRGAGSRISPHRRRRRPRARPRRPSADFHGRFPAP